MLLTLRDTVQADPRFILRVVTASTWRKEKWLVRASFWLMTVPEATSLTSQDTSIQAWFTSLVGICQRLEMVKDMMELRIRMFCIFLPVFGCTTSPRRTSGTICPLWALNICAWSSALEIFLTWMKLPPPVLSFPTLHQIRVSTKRYFGSLARLC